MRLEERHVKWCLTKNCEFGAEIAVSESVKGHVLHWPMPQRNVPLGSEQFCCKELCTKVFRIFLLCRKETRGPWEMSRDHFARCEKYLHLYAATMVPAKVLIRNTREKILSHIKFYSPFLNKLSLEYFDLRQKSKIRFMSHLSFLKNHDRPTI